MTSDPRNIHTGNPIPKENYCDQPYVVLTREGHWLCVLTTGPGLESRPGQHVVAAISRDQGAAWSDLIDVEPSGERMTSWVTALVTPGGRVYAIYNYQSGPRSTQHGGQLCYRYSDDGGRTWSAERYRIPMRATSWDRDNVTLGEEHFFWCIDKPVIADGSVFFSLPKMHSGVPQGRSEGWVIHSPNLLTETDPAQVYWELLPKGDTGIRNPDLGDIQEEQNLEVLSDGSLYLVYRTEAGCIGHSISRDGGHTWTEPLPLAYPDGRPLKNPRACPKIGKATNGNYLLWYHNNGYPGWGNSAVRNPVWLTGGVEVETPAGPEIRWAQPEILLYDPDPTIRGMSYPDFIEQGGRYWVTETEKTVARVHELDPTLLHGLWNQHTNDTVTHKGLIYESPAPLTPGENFALPPLPNLQEGGFCLDLWFWLDDPSPGQTLLSSFGPRMRGFQVSTAGNCTLRLDLSDNRQRHWLEVVDGHNPAENVRSIRQWNWETDPGLLETNRLHHVVLIVDGLANVVSMVVDGRLNDGGADRIQGWWRLNPWLGEIDDEGRCQVGADLAGRIECLRVYGRYLRTSEAIAHYRAGCPGGRE
jgi:hypothetical protein